MSNKQFNKIVGDKGEEIALKYLKSNRYKILDTNYKNKIGEIDIIAKEKDVIVFVEVKCKSNDYFGLPREEVTPRKINKIRNVATYYLKATKQWGSICRFDVIDIIAGELTHIKDCF